MKPIEHRHDERRSRYAWLMCAVLAARFSSYTVAWSQAGHAGGDEPPSSAAKSAKPRKWILVVDDDRAIRTLLGRVLSNAGYAVIAAADGREAQELMVDLHPHLVILDLRMPRLSGLQVLADTRQTPVIVLSGFLGDLSEDAAAQANIVARLQKPVGLDELRAAVRGALRE